MNILIHFFKLARFLKTFSIYPFLFTIFHIEIYSDVTSYHKYNYLGLILRIYKKS